MVTCTSSGHAHHTLWIHQISEAMRHPRRWFGKRVKLLTMGYRHRVILLTIGYRHTVIFLTMGYRHRVKLLTMGYRHRVNLLTMGYTDFSVNGT